VPREGVEVGDLEHDSPTAEIGGIRVGRRTAELLDT
jgi:hypothetical protein